MKCSRCGVRFNISEARSKFNHYYSQSSQWDYDTIFDEPMCIECAFDDAEERWANGDLEDEHEDDH